MTRTNREMVPKFFPSQAFWALASVSKSNVKARKDAASFVLNSAKKNQQADREQKELYSQFPSFCDQLIKLCHFMPNDKVRCCFNPPPPALASPPSTEHLIVKMTCFPALAIVALHLSTSFHHHPPEVESCIGCQQGARHGGCKVWRQRIPSPYHCISNFHYQHHSGTSTSWEHRISALHHLGFLNTPPPPAPLPGPPTHTNSGPLHFQGT